MAIPQREDGDFIEGIYNWCDRWCERCPMTTRCRQYAMECTRDAFNADGSNDGDSAEFMESLICAAGEFESNSEGDFEAETENHEAESDFEDFDMEEYMAERDRIDRATSETPCVKLADRYMATGSRWLEEWDILLEKLNENCPEILDSTDVISWYLMQIPVKLRRAINGKIEDDIDFMEDVYGSAKVVLIGADRSLEAWQKIKQALPEDKRDSVAPVIEHLREVIDSTEAAIPEARQFKRPGLDD